MLNTTLPQQPQMGERWRNRYGLTSARTIREVANATVKYSLDGYEGVIFETSIGLWLDLHEPILQAPVSGAPSFQAPGQPQVGERWRARGATHVVVIVREITDRTVRYSHEGLMETVAGMSFSIWQDVPFVMEQFQEATTRVTHAAKAEVDAYVTGVVRAAGLEAIAGGRIGARTATESIAAIPTGAPAATESIEETCRFCDSPDHRAQDAVCVMDDA